MKKIYFVFALLIFVLTGCGGKPGKNDLTKSFNESFENFKQIGVDLGQYIEASDFEIIDSYAEGEFYIVKAIPIISVKKDLDEGGIGQIKERTKLLYGPVMLMINMFETLKKYDSGGIDQQEMMREMRMAQYRKPEGSLKSGDRLKGLESTYKFRKTDNGWMAVD